MTMNSQEPFLYGGETGEHTSQPSGPTAPGPYKFSEEELRVLKECNLESFYQRSLPLGTLFGLGTFSAIQRGSLKPSPRFGPYPKVTLAVVVGYFLGKMSYQRACADKLMALPNSYIGQLLREKRDGAGLGPRRMQPAPPMLGAQPDEIYSDAGPGSSLDLDVDRPLFSDDTYRPTDSEGGGGGAGPALPARPSASYDELRRHNRGEYSAARQDPYRVEPNSVPVVTRPRQSVESRSSTNEYGDVMD